VLVLLRFVRAPWYTLGHVGLEMRVDIGAQATVALVLAVLAARGEARAESDAERTARAAALYDEAVKAMAAKDARACPKLEEVVKLEPEALGALFLLAECYEASDRLASAWGAFLRVEAAAVKAGKRPMRDQAHERAERLKPSLAQLIIAVPEEVQQLPGLEIQRDGEEVRPATFGVPLPVDTGNHHLSVTAQGQKRVDIPFTLEEDGRNLTVNVRLPRDATPAPQPSVGPEVPRADAIPAWLRVGTHVRIESNDPSKPLALFLVEQQVSLGGAQVLPLEVCRAPCNQEVSVPPGYVFFLGGKGITESARFSLAGLRRVSINASPGSRSQFVGGFIAGSIGATAVVAGLTAVAFEATRNPSLAPGTGNVAYHPDGGALLAGSCTLVAGVVVTIVGFSVAGSGRTTYTLDGTSVGLRF
jgi:hypothetical protein